MRKLLPLICLITLAGICAAQSGKEWVGNYVKTLNAAKSLDATYTVQTLGGVPYTYHVQLSKPNLAKIDTAKQEIVADGTNIYTYDKISKAYFSKSETTDTLQGVFEDSELSIWQGFFDPNAMSKLPEASLVGPKIKGGKELTEVDAIIDWAGQKRETFYFDKNELAKQAEIKLQNPDTTTLLIVDKVQLKTEAGTPDSFAFNEPSGSHQVSLEDASSGHWFASLADAQTIAVATHRHILLEFVTPNSPYCTQMETDVFSQPEFKYFAKNYVFCRLDMTGSPELTQKFNVKGAPDCLFLNSKGQRLNSVLGYMPKGQFLALMQQIVTANPPT